MLWRAGSIGALTALALACGTEPASRAPSAGLKIFVTARAHGGDFAHDAALPGDTAMQKADAFCAADPARPSDAIYRALLVDGTTRDAPSRRDWVLRPETTYYRPTGDVPIGTTTAAAVFAAVWQPLAHAIGEGGGSAWTGIGDASDLAAGQTCDGWSSATNAFSGDRGLVGARSGDAFAAPGGYGCYHFELPIYCVEQPAG